MATVTQPELMQRTLAAMEDDLRITPKQGRDFAASLLACIEEAVENGDKLNVFNIVTLTPVGVPAKPRRMGRNPQTGEEKMLDAKPASLKVRGTVGSRVKQALPSTTTK